MADLTDFDGCRRACRKAGHTLVWGECEHAPEPPAAEPTVYITQIRIADDGWPVVSYQPVKVADLDEVRALQAELARIQVEVPKLCDAIEDEANGAFQSLNRVNLDAIRNAVKAGEGA